MKEEQDRITREIAETETQLAAADVEIDRIEAVVRRSLDFLVNCHATYVMAAPQLRRQMNQAVFEAFFVANDGALMAKPNDWFRSLLTPDFLQSGRSKSKGGGSAVASLHDTSQWHEGLPVWLAEHEKAKGRNSEDRSTPGFIGVGLNFDHLAEVSGLEQPTSTLRMETGLSSDLGIY